MQWLEDLFKIQTQEQIAIIWFGKICKYAYGSVCLLICVLNISGWYIEKMNTRTGALDVDCLLDGHHHNYILCRHVNHTITSNINHRNILSPTIEYKPLNIKAPLLPHNRKPLQCLAHKIHSINYIFIVERQQVFFFYQYAACMQYCLL